MTQRPESPPWRQLGSALPRLHDSDLFLGQPIQLVRQRASTPAPIGSVRWKRLLAVCPPQKGSLAFTPQEDGVQHEKCDQADPRDDLDRATAEARLHAVANDPQDEDRVAGNHEVSNPRTDFGHARPPWQLGNHGQPLIMGTPLHPVTPCGAPGRRLSPQPNGIRAPLSGPVRVPPGQRLAAAGVRRPGMCNLLSS